MSSAERARSTYVDVVAGGDLGAAMPVNLDGGGSLWAAAARAHMLLHGDGDLDAAHRVLVDAIDGGTDPDGEPEALAAALDTLLMVCRFADQEALWLPYRALAARHAAGVPAAPDPTEPDPTEPDPTEPDPTETVRAGWSLLEVDGVERRGAALRRLLDDGRHGGAVGPAINAAVLLALDAVAAGRWDDTCRLVGHAQVLCASHGHEALGMLATAGSALVAACRGDEAACHDQTSAMIGWAAPRGARLVHRQAIHARVLAASGRGDAESAYHLAATITPPGTVEPPDGVGRLLVMDLVEAAVRTQRRDEAAAHIGGMRRAGISDVSARSALLVAGAAALAEHGDRATSRYELALAAPGVEAWPFDVARVRLAYGEHLRRSRAMLEARLQLTAALATFRRLGADPWIARAESELRAAGHHVLRARGTASTVLSHQERTVARLAATGATNRQIGQQLGLSPRTVGSHLTRVFQALAALGRGDAEAAFRHATAVTRPGRPGAPGTAARRVSMDLVEAAVRVGRGEEARRHVQAMCDLPRHTVSARFAMLTIASAALVAGPEEAAALFAEALATPDAERWPFDQARIQLSYGEHLRRQRRVGPSRVVLGAALDTFQRLGAQPWAAQARYGLRASGLTIGHRVAPGAAAPLTPDERAVAALAASGLTNKEIARQLMVSHHTVAARLYQVFPKLGIGSRAALRNAMLVLDGYAAGRPDQDAALVGIA